MAPRKDDTPSVATYADHEVITPPHALRKAIAPAQAGDDDPVARAEAALEELVLRVCGLDACRVRAAGSGAPGTCGAKA